jgi:hypothetical protein
MVVDENKRKIAIAVKTGREEDLNESETEMLRYRIKQLFGSVKRKIGSSFKLLREDLLLIFVISVWYLIL